VWRGPGSRARLRRARRPAQAEIGAQAVQRRFLRTLIHPCLPPVCPVSPDIRTSLILACVVRRLAPEFESHRPVFPMNCCTGPRRPGR
jgi:hypothetical protein